MRLFPSKFTIKIGKFEIIEKIEIVQNKWLCGLSNIQLSVSCNIMVYLNHIQKLKLFKFQEMTIKLIVLTLV